MIEQPPAPLSELAEKRPRQYAAEIVRLPRKEWPAALERVPERLRDWVRSYLRGWLQVGHKRKPEWPAREGPAR
jgi:hypothetical protein